jgi:histone H4
MSGRGKGAKGVGRGGARRHRTVLKDTVLGVTNAAIRRLARRGRIKRINGLFYDETRCVLKTYLEKVIGLAMVYTKHARRKTVSALDVVHALQKTGTTLLGYGGP